MPTVRDRHKQTADRGARYAYARALGLMILFALLHSQTSIAAEASLHTTDAGYAGSTACEGCHTYIYNRWRTTRHSYSVKTARQAKQAGYPLPQQRRGGSTLRIKDWNDVSYVIGGRQRIAYADCDGQFQDTSFHHRVQSWDVFPELPMTVCAGCHYTGVGSGPEHPGNRVLPGRWVEPNIACEACHGPAARHVDTLAKSDVRKDPSSRVCGQCHTQVGKILPKGELHDTHDLVQTWNQDPHVTRLRQHSSTAFCADCHSPYDGPATESAADAHRAVFAEDKQNITCIGCHDPHNLTNKAYAPGTVSLAMPLEVTSTTYEGNDVDFTTTDHREWTDANQSCLRCHRGADRVDLDHADAGCVDCHNTYNRNHSRESRQFHDANQPQLSCRGCHENATRLMAILHRDPDFLDPKHIHNLRTLPEAVRTRYNLRYPGLRARHTIAAIGESPNTTKTSPKPIERAPVAVDNAQRDDELRVLLSGTTQRHTNDLELQSLRDALLAAPTSTDQHLQLAQALVIRGETATARRLLQRASRLDSSRLLLELPLHRRIDSDADTDAISHDIAARVAELLPDKTTTANPPLKLWLRAHLAMQQGRFALAENWLQGAPHHIVSDFQRALAVLGQGDYRRAQVLLESLAQEHPAHHALQATLGFVQLARRRSAPAIAALQRASELAPNEGSARLLLGHARLRSGDLTAALDAYHGAVEVDPSLIQARFAIAQAYQYGGRADLASKEYRAIIKREPRLFEARRKLANLLKLLSDRVAFALQSERESNPPPGSEGAKWHARLTAWEKQMQENRNLALGELAVATRLRPDVLDSWRQIAEIYRRSGRLNDAERFYQWLAKREPHVWLHHYRLGAIHIAQGRNAKAAGILRQVIEKAPTDGDSYLALGLALVRNGELDEAIATFEKARIFEPFNPALYTNLGAAYANRGDLERAQVALERSLQLHSFPLPRVHLSETNLALVHLRAGRREQAVIALRRALHRYADYPVARELLHRVTRSAQALAPNELPPFVYNDWLERFGEITTVAFGNE